MKKRKKLSIDEMKKLLSEGKRIQLCVYVDPKDEKKRKKEIEKLARRFSRSIGGI